MINMDAWINSYVMLLVLMSIGFGIVGGAGLSIFIFGSGMIAGVIFIYLQHKDKANE